MKNMKLGTNAPDQIRITKKINIELSLKSIDSLFRQVLISSNIKKLNGITPISEAKIIRKFSNDIIFIILGLIKRKVNIFTMFAITTNITSNTKNLSRPYMPAPGPVAREGVGSNINIKISNEMRGILICACISVSCLAYQIM